MTPAERLILSVLDQEYRRCTNPRQTPFYIRSAPFTWDELGPYGRTSVRTGVNASRVAEIELDVRGKHGR